MDNWIFKYHEAIQKKEVIVGVWVRLCFEILTTGLLNGEWEFNEKKANKAIKFIENFCHHSEGRSDLLHLELWQKAIVSAIFGIMDKTTGYRQFREVFIIVARKNGKTLFAAAIAAYMTYVDGEYGAKVYFLAPKLDQADLVYDVGVGKLALFLKKGGEENGNYRKCIKFIPGKVQTPTIEPWRV